MRVCGLGGSIDSVFSPKGFPKTSSAKLSSNDMAVSITGLGWRKSVLESQLVPH